MRIFFLFFLLIFFLLLSALITNHQGFALKIENLLFGVLVIVVIIYFFQIRTKE